MNGMGTGREGRKLYSNPSIIARDFTFMSKCTNKHLASGLRPNPLVESLTLALTRGREEGRE